MPHIERRTNRARRNSSRNASNGVGGNSPPEKPRLKSKEDVVPVRKPKLTVTAPKPKSFCKVSDPAKVRTPKPKGMSLTCTALKCLTDFTGYVSSLR